jgi:hypothetical protein
LNKKYLQITGDNLTISCDVPKRFRDKEYVLDIVKSLDEGRDFITKESFDSFQPAIHHFKIDYLTMRARNLQEPIIQLWKLDWK